MDKRYLLMLLIIIVCCINLSIIVNNSDIVGSASIGVENYLFSVPEGFNLYENDGHSVTIQNKDNITMYIETNLSNNDNYNSRLNYIENGTGDTILSKGTVSIENISVYTVYYRTSDNVNQSAFYFEKDNEPFKIVASNFNYNNDRDLILDYSTFIIKSLKDNYKMG